MVTASSRHPRNDKRHLATVSETATRNTFCARRFYWTKKRQRTASGSVVSVSNTAIERQPTDLLSLVAFFAKLSVVALKFYNVVSPSLNWNATDINWSEYMNFLAVDEQRFQKDPVSVNNNFRFCSFNDWSFLLKTTRRN